MILASWETLLERDFGLELGLFACLLAKIRHLMLVFYISCIKGGGCEQYRIRSHVLSVGKCSYKLDFIFFSYSDSVWTHPEASDLSSMSDYIPIPDFQNTCEIYIIRGENKQTNKQKKTHKCTLTVRILAKYWIIQIIFLRHVLNIACNYSSFSFG